MLQGTECIGGAQVNRSHWHVISRVGISTKTLLLAQSDCSKYPSTYCTDP